MSPEPLVRVVCSNLQTRSHQDQVLPWAVPRPEGMVVGPRLWLCPSSLRITAPPSLKPNVLDLEAGGCTGAGQRSLLENPEVWSGG